MSKITLTDLANLQNENTAVNAINTNNAVLEAALDNTISRDGSQPNQMTAALDMNSNRILNLPEPVSADEPVRLQDIADLEAGTPVVFNALPTGGAQGNVLIKNSTTNYDAVWGGNSLRFDKRSDVTTSRIPASITSIVINRYDTGYPVQPATYTRGNSGSTLAIQDAGGNYWGIIGQLDIYPEYWGAMRDGTTDDAPAIRSAIAYLHGITTSGAQGVLRLADGTYLIGSIINGVNFAYAIPLYSEISIIGVGDASVLKVKTNLNPAGFTFLSTVSNSSSDRQDDVTLRDFKIDGNTAGNTYNVYMAGIYSGYHFNFTIDNVYFYTWPGSQPISLGRNAGLAGEPANPSSVNARVTNCKFYETGNSLLTDTSNIYVVGTDFIVANNWSVQSVLTTVGTAIEVHGVGVCSGNVCRSYFKAFNVGAYPDSFVTLTGNYTVNNKSFCTIWETLGGGNPNFTTNCIISNNIIYVASSASSTIDMGATAGTTNSYVKICDNYFESLEAAGTASTGAVIAGGKIKNLEVYNNTAVNFAGCFFQQLQNGTSGSVIKMQGNHIIDCGRGSNAGVRLGIDFSLFPMTCDVINITDNTIKNTSTVYMTTGIKATAGNANLTATTGRGRILNNNIFNVTTPISWAGTGRMDGFWITYTPTLTAGSGTPTTTSTAGRYKTLDDSMFIELIGSVTTVGTAAGDMNFTLPTGITIAGLNQTINGKDTGTGKAIAGSAVAAATSITGVRFYDNTTIWANGAVATLVGTIQIVA